MRAFRAVLAALWRSQYRDPVGLFFSIVFAPMLVLVLGAIFGNTARPEFGGRGMLDATLPAFGALVLAASGVMQLPLTLLTLRETGALRRLGLTPLRRSTFLAATVTLGFLIGLAGLLAAFAIGVLVFGVSLPGNILGVLGACAFGLVTFLAVGYALAALYPSIGAATAVGNIAMIILMLTTGAFTPISVMPEGVRRAIGFSPLRWFVELTQGLWDGAPLRSVALPFLLLCGLLAVSVVAGRLLFRWQPSR